MREPITTNAADETQVEHATQRERADSEALRAAYRALFGTYQSRLAVWQVIEQCRVFREIAGTTEECYRALGARTIGLRLIADGERYAGAELVRQMREEALARELEAEDIARATRMRRRTPTP